MTKTLTPLTSDDYKPLHTLLPLKTPLSLTFCSTQKCNFFCEFCYRHAIAQSKLSSESMPLDFLEKLAADVAAFEDQVGVVDICGSGEPLLLPYVAAWIRLLKNTSNIKQLKMITNGTLLTPQKAEEVINAGLDLIIVSINGMSDAHYKKVVHVNVNFDRLVENIKYVYKIKGRCRLHIKCIGDYFSGEEKEKFMEIFSPITDTINIDNAIHQWLDCDLPTPPHRQKSISRISEFHNRFGKDFVFSERPMCNFPFFYMRVHSSGKVSACATNWEDRMIVGDAKIQSLKTVWNSEELNNLRITLLKKEKVPNNCINCKSYEMMTGEDLTPYKDELLRQYSR